MPPTNEAPPSSKVPGVKGMSAKGRRNGARGMLTAKTANLTTKTANVTAKAAEMAAEATRSHNRNPHRSPTQLRPPLAVKSMTQSARRCRLQRQEQWPAQRSPGTDEQQAWREVVDRRPLPRGAERLHGRVELPEQPRRVFRAEGDRRRWR